MSIMGRRPKIALVVPSLTQGGGVPAVARFVKDTILRADHFDLKLISLATFSRDLCSINLSQPRTWLRGVLVKQGIWDDLPYLHVGAVGGELEFQRYRSRKVLTEILADCDIIQVVSGCAAWANAVVGLGKPVSLQVATRAKIERRLRDSDPNGLSALWRKLMTKGTDILDDRALRSVDAIQLENLWMLNYSKKINLARTEMDIRYAPPGVNTEVFFPLPTRAVLKNPYILCVGRLDDPRKNIGLLLDAFVRLPASLSHIHLITAGSGRPPEEYWAKVNDKGLTGRVHHVHKPVTTDLVALYQQASAFALSSDEEGLGVVILEAMACGVPVVATRCGGPDGIISEGKDGFLVPLDDAVSLAEKLILLCTDLRRNYDMGREARITIESRFADEITGRAFVDVWARLLQKSREVMAD